MSYTSLVAPKGTTGSLANWVNYSKLDTVTVLEEAQSLLFQLLRVREMRASWVFGLAAGTSEIALPSRFLDPIGKLRDLTNGGRLPHRPDTVVDDNRSYDTSLSDDFGTDPFTTINDSAFVTVEMTNHELTQGSTITIAGASAVGGLTLNGTYPLSSIIDDDTFVIDVGDEAATSSATGGGSAASWTANKLIAGTASEWSILNDKLQFNCALEESAQFKMFYFRSPLPLSATNLTNWLTVRYPKVLRVACMCASADFMKDDTEYNKHLTALSALVGSIAAENDLMFRGSEFGTDTPTPGDYY